MQTGEPRPARRRASREQGFTYLWLLFAVALGGAALAALGTQWQTKLQRERETELEFRGQQIARAIESYVRGSPRGTPPWPTNLQALLEDRRSGVLRRHLRRLYADPFTRAPDWALVTDADGGIRGVHSRASALSLRGPASPAASAASAVPRVSDRVFLAAVAPAASVPSPAGSVASSPRP